MLCGVKTEDLLRYERERNDVRRAFGPVRVELILPLDVEPAAWRPDPLHPLPSSGRGKPSKEHSAI